MRREELDHLRHANLQTFGIGGRIRRVERAVRGEHEPSVGDPLVLAVVLAELILRAELQIVAAARAGDEPTERVVQPVDVHVPVVGVVVVRLIDEAEELQRGRRLRPIAGVLIQRLAAFRFLVHHRRAHDVQLGSAEHAVIGAHERPVVVFLDAQGVDGAVSQHLVVIRLVIPQIANRVVVVDAQLVIDAPEVIPRVGLLRDGKALVRSARIRAAPAFVRSCRSKLAKKCILSRMIGPPMVPPYCDLARFRFGEVVARDEEVLRRHRRVGEVPDGAPAPRVRPLLGDRVDDAGRGRAVLRIELVGDDLELLNGLEWGPRLRARAAAAQVVVVAPAIHQEHDAAAMLAVDGDAIGRGIAGGVVDHAGQQRDQAGEVARPRRQLRELARRHVAADLRRREVHLRRLGGNRHVLFQAADAQRQIDLQRRADPQRRDSPA